MKTLVLLAAFAFVVRYFSLENGALIGATVAFGYTQAECVIHKVAVDLQADPTGTKTLTDCVEDDSLEFFLKDDADKT